MQFWFKLVLLAAALFAIGWFVSFQYDPYRVCVDHPDPQMKNNFYLCEPGGFTLQKGTRLERPEDDRFPWEKHGDVIIGTDDPRRRRLLEKEKKQKELDQWDCSDSFANLSDEDFFKLTNEELNKYCKLKTKEKRKDPPSLEQVPNIGTEEL